jgi:hypothetical protein
MSPISMPQFLSSRSWALWILPLLLIYPYPMYAQTPAHYSLQVDRGGQGELTGIPLRNPILASGLVQSGSASGQLTLQTPDLPASFGSLLKGDEPCYLEFVGPAKHPWLGHRLEIEVARTKQSTTGFIFVSSSYRNTKWPVDSAVAAGQVEIRSHIVLPTLLERVLKNQQVVSTELGERLYPPPAFASVAMCLSSGHMSSLFIWMDKSGKVLWGADPTTGVVTPEYSLILPPASAVALNLGPAPLGLGFSGDEVKTPVVAPIYAGTNLLCYPYMASLKLSPAWSLKNKFLSKTRGVSKCDRIVIRKEGKDHQYALYPLFGFGSYGVWQKQDPKTGNWIQPPEYLKEIDPGQGFYFISSQNYPAHTFLPP